MFLFISILILSIWSIILRILSEKEEIIYTFGHLKNNKKGNICSFC